MNPKRARKIVICGPTASGKSKLALDLALKIDGIIVNFDSQQIYSELPIISAQPTSKEQSLVPHYLYSVLTGEKTSSVANWLEMAKKIIDNNLEKNIIFVGGSGLYLNALLHGLSPIPNIPDKVRNLVRSMSIQEVILQLGKNYQFNDQRMRRRLEVKMATGEDLEWFYLQNKEHNFKPENFTVFNLSVPRETTYWCINNRFENMLKLGCLDEIKSIYNNNNYNVQSPIMNACGVKPMINYLDNKISIDQAIDKAKQSTRNYAKRQMTWFRHQLPLHTIEIDNNSLQLMLKYL